MEISAEQYEDAAIPFYNFVWKIQELFPLIILRVWTRLIIIYLFEAFCIETIGNLWVLIETIGNFWELIETILKLLEIFQTY